MRILVISQYYYPEQFLINDITQKLQSSGHVITVLTGLPNYPSGYIDEKYQNIRFEIKNNIQVIRCPIRPRKKGLINLLLNYISYVVLASYKVLKIQDNYDIVFVYQLTPVFQLIPAILYSKINRKKLLCYCLDLAPASGSGILNKTVIGKILYYIYKRISTYLYSKCDMICVTSKSFINYINTIHGIELQKLSYLPQHAPTIFSQISFKSKNKDKVDFMFAGNIGKGASLDTIIYATKIVKEKTSQKFIVHFVGEGSYKVKLQELVQELNLQDYILFHGQVPYTKMTSFYSLADVMLITLRKNQITIPSKLQAYMSVGKPILGSMDGSGRELIEESRCGKCVESEDFYGLACIMLEYINHPDSYRQCGDNGRIYVENNFTLELFNEKLNKILLKVLEEKCI